MKHRDDYDTPIASKVIVIIWRRNAAMTLPATKRMAQRLSRIPPFREGIPKSEEFEYAKQKGDDFHFTKPIEIGRWNGNVWVVITSRWNWAADASGRRRPVPIGSEFVIDRDYVIMSLGTKVNSLIRETTINITPT